MTYVFIIMNLKAGNVITFKTDELDMLDSPKKKAYSLTPKDVLKNIYHLKPLVSII
mgnify:CR=1 FL=1